MQNFYIISQWAQSSTNLALMLRNLANSICIGNSADGYSNWLTRACQHSIYFGMRWPVAYPCKSSLFMHKLSKNFTCSSFFSFLLRFDILSFVERVQVCWFIVTLIDWIHLHTYRNCRLVQLSLHSEITRLCSCAFDIWSCFLRGSARYAAVNLVVAGT